MFCIFDYYNGCIWYIYIYFNYGGGYYDLGFVFYKVLYFKVFICGFYVAVYYVDLVVGWWEFLF